MGTFEEVINSKITVYWWNFGKKTLDFKGSYKDYFAKNGIKTKGITHHGAGGGFAGIRFTISTSHHTTVLKTFVEPHQACADAVKQFCTLMGDKHLLIDGLGREHKINWR